MIRWIEFFLRVAEAGSFSKGAKLCGVGQPTVSKGILALESQLGTKLFHRNTRRLSLTEEGTAFYRQAGAVVESYEALMSLGGTTTAPSGVIKLSCPLALGTYHLIPMLRSFADRYPGIHLDIRFSDALADLVGEGIDLAIRVGELHDRGMTARKLGVLPRFLVGSSAYFEAHPPPQNPDELKNHRCIVYGLSRPQGVWTLCKRNKRVSVRVHGNLKVDSLMGLRSAVLSGFGIGLAGRLLFEERQLGSELRIALPEWAPHPLPVHLVFLDGKHMPRRLRLLLDFLVEAFATQPWLSHGPAIPANGN